MIQTIKICWILSHLQTLNSNQPKPTTLLNPKIRRLLESGNVYLTFLMRIDWSLRAKSIDLILRSRFFLAKTFFSEFLMWWVWCAFISRSIPLDCIFLCKIVSALSRSPESTLTLIPRSCCNWLWLARVTIPVTRFTIVFIFHCEMVFQNHAWERKRNTENRRNRNQNGIRLTGRNLAGEIKEPIHWWSRGEIVV